MSTALYELEHGRYVPSELTRGPWAPDAQHGGPPSALMTQALDTFDGDLAIYLHRHPAGEWVCLESTTVAEPHGVVLAESRLYDEQGAIGRSLQSLLLEQRAHAT